MSMHHPPDIAKWIGIFLVVIGQAFVIVSHFNEENKRITEKIHTLELVQKEREKYIEMAERYTLVISEMKKRDESLNTDIRSLGLSSTENFRDLKRLQRELREHIAISGHGR